MNIIILLSYVYIYSTDKILFKYKGKSSGSMTTGGFTRNQLNFKKII